MYIITVHTGVQQNIVFLSYFPDLSKESFAEKISFIFKFSRISKNPKNIECVVDD